MFEYRSGTEGILDLGISSGSAEIKAGDAVCLVSGFICKVTVAATAVYGVACDSATAPTTSGNKSVRVAIGREAVYEVPPSTGSFVVGDIGKKCDVAANAVSVIRTTSTQGDIEIIDVDTVRNTARVQLARPHTAA
jgi:hypothetical protein